MMLRLLTGAPLSTWHTETVRLRVGEYVQCSSIFLFRDIIRCRYREQAFSVPFVKNACVECLRLEVLCDGLRSMTAQSEIICSGAHCVGTPRNVQVQSKSYI